TSMATPHVSAVLALVASANPDLRGDPDRLVEIVKETAQPISGNETPPLDPSDTSPGDIGGPSCPTGYCHLGSDPIPAEDAYGAGLVAAAAAVAAATEEDEAVSQSQPEPRHLRTDTSKDGRAPGGFAPPALICVTLDPTGSAAERRRGRRRRAPG